MIEKLKKILAKEKVKDLIVYCGQGDKFLVRGLQYSKADNSVVLKLDPKSMIWIRMDERHPIKLTTEND